MSRHNKTDETDVLVLSSRRMTEAQTGKPLQAAKKGDQEERGRAKGGEYERSEEQERKKTKERQKNRGQNLTPFE